MLQKIIARSVGLVLVVSLFCTDSYAQNFSLEDCRSLAIENNRQLKIADTREKIAYYQKREALMNFFPDFSFKAGYQWNEKNLRLINPDLIPQHITTPPLGPLPSMDIDISDIRNKLLDATEVGQRNMWSLGFNITQPIFMGGKIIALNDIRAYAQELAINMKDTKLTDIIVEVDNAYWQVVSLASKKRLADSYVELLNKMESDITAMEEEGLATKADKLSVSVKLNEAEITQTKAYNGLSLSKMLLAQICGLEINDKLKLADESKESLPNENDIRLEQYSISEALENRTELKSLRIAQKIYGKQEKIALAEFLPRIGLTGGYEWTNPNLQWGFDKNFRGMWSVGIGLTVPLNFISSSAKLNVAKAESKIRDFELADAEEKVVLQVNQESYKLTEAQKKLIAANKNIEKADENLRYANIGFEEGVIPASDALAAHMAWIAAHTERIDAQIDLKLCRIYLDKALGRPIMK